MISPRHGNIRSLASTLIYNRAITSTQLSNPEPRPFLMEAFTNQDLFQQDPDAISDYPEKPTGSMVVINTSTGAIAAMQGSYGENNEPQSEPSHQFLP